MWASVEVSERLVTGAIGSGNRLRRQWESDSEDGNHEGGKR